MLKLLSANFSRLWKSKIFWLSMAFTFVFSVFICFANYRYEVGAEQILIDEVFFTFYSCFGVLCAVFTSLFVGTEYSDGSVRNKLVIGHKRTNIYLSNLITCIVASSAVVAVHNLITGVLGSILFGKFEMKTSEIIYAIICLYLLGAVFSAICLAVAMNCQNKAITSVATIILIIAVMYVSSAVGSQLLETEMTYDNIVMSMDGIEFGDMVPNPAYVDGTARVILDFIYDLLPTGQVEQIYLLDFESAEYWPFMSAGLFAVVSVLGVFIFKKKDIK